MAPFHKHSTISAQRLSFLCLGATRFATNFFMVARVFDVKEVLKQTVTDMDWDKYMKTL
jgi:hypothetical protein